MDRSGAAADGELGPDPFRLTQQPLIAMVVMANPRQHRNTEAADRQGMMLDALGQKDRLLRLSGSSRRRHSDVPRREQGDSLHTWIRSQGREMGEHGGPRQRILERPGNDEQQTHQAQPNGVQRRSQ